LCTVKVNKLIINGLSYWGSYGVNQNKFPML